MVRNNKKIINIYHGTVSLFCHLHHVTQKYANLNNTDQIFPDFEKKHLFYDNDDDEHLPIPVYSGIKPSILGEIFYSARTYFK